MYVVEVLERGTMLDVRLPRLLNAAEALEQALDAGCDTQYAQAKLNTLDAYWGNLQDLAVRQGLYLGDYDYMIEPFFQSLVRSRQRIEERAMRKSFWQGLLAFAVGLVNKVLRFFRLPTINRPLLKAAERYLLPPG